MTDDSLQARLLQLLADELEEHAHAMNADLLALESSPGDPERLRSLFRTAHTLKGAARAAGVTSLENACHSLEDRLAEIRDQARAVTARELEMLYSAADSFAEASRRLRAGEAIGSSVRTAQPPPEPPNTTPEPKPQPPDSGTHEPEGEKASEARDARKPDLAPAATVPAIASAPESRTLRVAPERLDDLLASAAEVLRLARRSRILREESDRLVDFAASWDAEWRRQVPHLLSNGGGRKHGRENRDGDRDPVMAVTENLSALGERARSLALRSTADSLQLARTAGQLATDIRLLRMRPFRELAETLPRTVRDLAASAGKEVRFDFEGSDIEVDRTVLDALREALIPLIRNAIDHGVESPEDRKRLGKPREAELRITAALHGDRVRVIVADDGAGIDADLLRRKYAAAGYPLPADDEALAAALLGGGVSSRARASVISGRGVGLDIVRAVMARVRGTVELEWESNAGTRVVLEFPPSLANLRALLIAIGSQTFALPTSSVTRILRVSTDSLRSLEGHAVLPDPEGAIPVLPLARVLGPPLVERPIGDSFRALIMADNGTRVALVVDDVTAEEELILRPIPMGDRTLPLIAGAAILGHGGVVPVLDAPALLAAVRRATPGALPVRRIDVEKARRHILVVDDSLTTRTLEQSVLEAAGFHVTTASDGLDALRALQAETIDLVVSDVEMPRLDGFRLCESIRASERFRGIPVILVTARERPEDRGRGMEAGADAYLPKSSFDQEQLLATIEQLLGE